MALSFVKPAYAGGYAAPEDAHVRQSRGVDDYQQHTHQGQIYASPDTYIGSAEQERRNAWVFNPETGKLVQISMTLPEGVERLFLEIASNSGDNADASRRMGVSPGSIDVTMDATTITVRNGGEPIPLYPTSASTLDAPQYVPEFIFGVLLTSSNYDTKVIRMGCGKNGYGAKLTSIFSRYARFRVGDPKNGQEWEGVWTNNMTEKTTSITPGHVWDPSVGRWVCKGAPYTGPSYVEVTWYLDFARFGYPESYPAEALPLFSRLTLDFGFTCKIPVSINGVQFNVQNIRDYAQLYWKPEQIEKSIVHYEWPGGVAPPGWDRMTKKQREATIANPPSVEYIPLVEIMCIDTPDAGVCLSYVNGLMTIEGGVHVNEAYASIGGHFLEQFNKYTTAKKAKGKDSKGGKAKETKPKAELEITAKLDMKDLKAHMSMLINCRLPNSKYRSQSKTYLTSPKPTIKIDEDELKPLGSWDLFDRLSASLDAKLFKTIKKDERKTRGRVHLDKGVEANFAGTSRSRECILYIVEGKSASAYPKKRIALTPGNKDLSGYYPIKGKFPNILKMIPIQIANNKEIRDIRKLLGLREGVDYLDPADIATLRYGLIIITTDMDTDGTHIRMLLITFFRKYLGLLKHGMVCYLMTFAVRLFDGPVKNGKCVGRFPSVTEYEAWDAAHPGHGYEPKYYKGLATSRDSDIQDDLTTASLVVCMYDDEAPTSLEMAFGKDSSDARKVWIARWRDKVQTDDIIFIDAKDLVKYRSITNIINRDLIDYTIDALFRAIPSEFDLLKKSQRQALYYVLDEWKYGHARKGSTNVDRIACGAAEKTKYHHGVASMITTIIRMCQSYVGSNNLPIFMQEGQMGTRDMGGEDAGAARYCETAPEWWLGEAINKEMVDLVPRRIVEGKPAEPIFIPCDIPLGIINGFSGMATGHSTYSPPHSLYQVINSLYAMCAGHPTTPLKPHFRGFKGTVEVTDTTTLPSFEVPKARKSRVVLDSSSSVPAKSRVKLPIPVVDESKVDDSDDETSPREEGEEGEVEEDTEKAFEYKPPKRGKRTIITKGIFEITQMYEDGSADVTVTELPIGKWIDDYHHWLDDLEDEGQIRSFLDNSSTDTVLFRISGFKNVEGVNHKTLRLQTSFGYNNITLINNDGHPKVYDSIDQLLRVYYENMIVMYETLRCKQISDAENEYAQHSFMRKFIHLVIEGQIVVFKQKVTFIHEQMTTHGIPHDCYTRAKLHQFDAENLERLAKEMEECLAKIAYLKTLTPQVMWAERLKSLHANFVKSGYVE